jgi:hypothetical protein
MTRRQFSAGLSMMKVFYVAFIVGWHFMVRAASVVDARGALGRVARVARAERRIRCITHQVPFGKNSFARARNGKGARRPSTTVTKGAAETLKPLGALARSPQAQPEPRNCSFFMLHTTGACFIVPKLESLKHLLTKLAAVPGRRFSLAFLEMRESASRGSRFLFDGGETVLPL